MLRATCCPLTATSMRDADFTTAVDMRRKFWIMQFVAATLNVLTRMRVAGGL